MFKYLVQLLVINLLINFSIAMAQCTSQAGELGYDYTANKGYISSNTVSENLELTLDCQEGTSLSSINIDFYVGETKCTKFEWEVIKSSSTYGGGFPKGYLGMITYKVSNQIAQEIASGSFNVSSGRTTFKDCPLNKKTKRRPSKCQKSIAKLNTTAEKRLCTKILDNFRGPIILRPK